MNQPLNLANPLTMLLMAAAIATASEQSFTDSRDGKKYKAVKIGEQVWMAENLNYKTGISRCYDDNESNCKEYGRLYDWETAMKACPSGWHLPSKEEWNELVKAAGGNVAGKNLRAATGWNSKAGGSGFNGEFGHVQNFGAWWSSSECDLDGCGRSSYLIRMRSQDEDTEPDYSGNDNLLSVRCVADAERYLFEQNFAKNDIPVAYGSDDYLNKTSYVPNIGFSAGKRVIYNGSVKLLDHLIPETALAVLDKKELRILRNAIFAKHGMIFQSDDLKAHFPKFNWYKPQSKDVNKKLTEVDKKNIENIQTFENAKPNLKINKKDLAGSYSTDIHPAREDGGLEMSDNNTIGYYGLGDEVGENNFRGSYKIENGFLVVFVTEQRVPQLVDKDNTEYFLNKNWHWPSGVTYKDHRVTYKEPIKMVFPVGDVISNPESSDRKGRQIGSVKWWIDKR